MTYWTSGDSWWTDACLTAKYWWWCETLRVDAVSLSSTVPGEDA